jgi:nucleoside-diphosphate-sugar epimerase
LNLSGHHVVALDLLPAREHIEGVTYVTHDIRRALPEALPASIDRIYNLAAVHRTPGHEPHEYYETNVPGALNVVAFATARNIREILFTSSIAVYGPGEREVDESVIPQPVSDYGRSKLMAEQIHAQWQLAAPDRRLVVVRPGVVFGPGEHGNYMRLAKALRSGYFVFPGRTDTVKSGGYVSELVDTMDFAWQAPSGKTLYNFADPQQHSIADIVEEICAIHKYKVRPLSIPLPFVLAVAGLFSVASKVGFKSGIHPERIYKLVRSNRIRPSWLISNGYVYKRSLGEALRDWHVKAPGEI